MQRPSNISFSGNRVINLAAAAVLFAMTSTASAKVKTDNLTLNAGESITLPVNTPYSTLRVDAVGRLHTKGYTHGDAKESWGMTLLDSLGHPRMQIRLTPGNDQFDTSTSRPYMRATIDSIDTHGNTIRIADKLCYDTTLGQMNSYNGLRAECAGGYAKISAGRTRTTILAETPWPVEVAAARIDAGGKTTIMFTDAVAEPLVNAGLDSGWNIDELSAHLSRAEGICGLWQMLDRDTNASLAEPGGLYTLAIVPHKHAQGCGCDNPGHARPLGATARSAIYDIIYISGATAYTEKWVAGTIKGRLYPTGFENHYALYWLDADKFPAGVELSADFSAPALITFHFPLLKAHLRFTRLSVQMAENLVKKATEHNIQ